MIAVLAVAADLLREAASRRWFLALGLTITAFLIAMGLSLELQVVNGALAASRLFGEALHADIRAVDVALRPVFRAAAYFIFYGGMGFGIIACADFGPSLLAPGRIEHLLSLPVRRWSLLAGTFAGVLVVAVTGAAYGAGGFTLILGAKTGVFTPRLLFAALLAATSFAAIYGAMLTAAMFARSAAVSALVGLLLSAAGIVAGYREQVAPMFESGLARRVFLWWTLYVPPISALADASASIAGTVEVDTGLLLRRLVGLLVFGVAALLIGMWRFERMDF